MSRSFFCGNESETIDLAGRLAPHLEPGMFVSLCGDLGSGKTAFVRGVGIALGYDRVTSPTFTIVQEYDTDPRLYHFDAYRLSGSNELHAMGFDDYLDGSGVILMEWPEIVLEAIPDQRLEIRLKVIGEGREIEMLPFGERYERMVGKL